MTFVGEPKGDLFTDALRPVELVKINYGREHFKALGTEVQFRVANNCNSFTNKQRFGNKRRYRICQTIAQ
jgi:type III restriction enzyme